MPLQFIAQRSVAMLLAISVAIFHREASGCGASGPGISLLLPRDRAVDVPLDAVLQASSLDSGARFNLVDTSDDSIVDVTVSCHEYRGFVCIATPAELRPYTTYSWIAVTDSKPAVESPPFSFSTGDFTLPSPLLVESSELIILGDFQQPEADCNASRRLELSLAVSASGLPAVLTIDNALPMHVNHAFVVDDASSVDFVLYDPPDCFTARLTDIAGNSVAYPKRAPHQTRNRQRDLPTQLQPISFPRRTARKLKRPPLVPSRRNRRSKAVPGSAFLRS
jgi:hypothetical protein